MGYCIQKHLRNWDTKSHYANETALPNLGPCIAIKISGNCFQGDHLKKHESI